MASHNHNANYNNNNSISNPSLGISLSVGAPPGLELDLEPTYVEGPGGNNYNMQTESYSSQITEQNSAGGVIANKLAFDNRNGFV